MNPRLRALLDRVGLPGADAPDLWRRTVVLKNYGSIPMLPDASTDSANLGFLLLFLDDAGRPRHFGKCRPARDPGFERECRILDRLTGEPDLEGFTLEVRTGRSGPLRLHLSEHLDEPRYDAVVRGQEPDEWVRCARRVLRAAGRVCRAAAEHVPGVAPGREIVRPGRALEERVGRLAATGTDSRMLDRVAAALGDVELPSEVQHGDLWPGNVFTTPDGTPRRLFDLERVGVIDVPLFDLFHWLWSSAWLLDHGRRGPWLPLHGDPGATGGGEHAGSFEGASGRIGRSSGGGPWKRVARELVWEEAGRLGLDEEQVGAALLFSVVEMAAHRRRPGAPSSFARPLLQDLERLDGRLREGGRLSDLVAPPVSLPAAARRTG